MSNPPEVFFFGCTGRAGHAFHAHNRYQSGPIGPWGYRVDGALLEEAKLPDTPDGRYIELHRDGWTAISFWDRSGGDTRPGCNSAFVVQAEMTGPELIAIARQQWPEIFTRPGFPKALQPR